MACRRARAGDSDGDGDLDYDDIAGLVALSAGKRPVERPGGRGGPACAAPHPGPANKRSLQPPRSSAAWAAEVDIAPEPLGRRRWKYGPAQE